MDPDLAPGCRRHHDNSHGEFCEEYSRPLPLICVGHFRQIHEDRPLSFRCCLTAGSGTRAGGKTERASGRVQGQTGTNRSRRPRPPRDRQCSRETGPCTYGAAMLPAFFRGNAASDRGFEEPLSGVTLARPPQAGRKRSRSGKAHNPGQQPPMPPTRRRRSKRAPHLTAGIR